MINLLSSEILGNVTGGVFAFIRVWMEQRHEFMLKMASQDDDAMQEARKTTNEHFNFTRRTIALIITMYVFGGLLFAAIMHYPIYVSYSVKNGFFASLFGAESTTHWHMIKSGFVLCPIVFYSLGFVLAFYFAGKRRL